jgi:hypothetical protein
LNGFGGGFSGCPAAALIGVIGACKEADFGGEEGKVDSWSEWETTSALGLESGVVRPEVGVGGKILGGTGTVNSGREGRIGKFCHSPNKGKKDYKMNSTIDSKRLYGNWTGRRRGREW